MNGQPLQDHWGLAFRGAAVISLLLTVAILSVTVGRIAGAIFLAIAVISVLGRLAWNETIPMLGIVLAIMPAHFLAILLGQFYGIPQITLISVATKEIPLLLLGCILWSKNGVEFYTADYFLGAFFVIGAISLGFGGGIRGFIDDFGFILAYAVGRVTVLRPTQERIWANSAVWIAAVLSVVGMIEVFAIGDSARKMLYAVTPGNDDLFTSFEATGFEGLREASTMAGPLSFGVLCMVALIIWWVYLRNPIPAAIVFAGLICTLTRSAWIGVTVAIAVLAFRMKQVRRLASYALLGILLFIAAIPILGLSDFLFFNRAGQDESSQVHSTSLLTGLEYVASHPLGTGAESIGPRVVQQDRSALNIESTYLTLAAEYGVLGAFCFIGFIASLLKRIWTNTSELGDVAVAILSGFAIVMFFLPIHQDFRLSCWVWVPIGMALRPVHRGSSTLQGRAV